MSNKRRKSSTSPSRKEQRRAAHAAHRRRQRLKVVAWTGGAVAVLALLIFLGVSNAANRPGEPVPDMGNLHIEEGTKSPVAYNSTPPTSGPHYDSLARWGVHTEPIPDELMVHNLEDGGVGIWYNCPDGCPELLDQLELIAADFHEGVILAPYPGMDSPIALTAWTRIDKLDDFDEERILRFVKAFRGADHHAP